MRHDVTLSQLNEYLQTFATLGAIIGLMAVGYEVRQSNKIAEATFDFEVQSNLGQVNELLLDNPELQDLLVRANTGTEVSAREQVTLVTFNRRLLNIWLAAETAYDNGMLPRATYETLFDDVQHLIEDAGPVRRRSWRQLLDDFPSAHNTRIVRAAYVALEKAIDDEEPKGSGAR